jgi:hypothetical protein
MDYKDEGEEIKKEEKNTPEKKMIFMKEPNERFSKVIHRKEDNYKNNSENEE